MKDYNNIDWCSIFYYDETSPSGLRWRVDRRNISGTICAKTGDVAGSVSDKGYWVIPFAKSYYKAHRIVWILINGFVPKNMQIDHLDRNRQNNHIKNLRLVDFHKNRRNSSKSKNNTTNFTGVHWYYSKGYTYCTAKWQQDSKIKVKRFSVKKYGLLEAFNLACEHRKQKIKELNELGYGYSDNHGQ